MKRIKTERIKVLWLPSWYSSRAMPALARFVQRHGEAASLFCSVFVVYPVPERGAHYEVEFNHVNDNMLEVLIYYPETSFKWLKLLRMIYAAWKGYRIVKKEHEKPHIIHLSVIYPAGFAALFLHFIAKLPLVIDEHWSGYRPEDGSYKGIIMKLLANACVRRSKHVFTVSPVNAEAMISHGLKGRYSLIPNVIDKMAIKENWPQKKNKTFRFLHASGLKDREKNVTGILKAVRELLKFRKDFCFEIAGAGGNEEFLKQLVEEWQMHEFISFPGFLDRQTLRQKMADANAFVLFSNYEGLPCVVLEAMSVGTPVICTEIGGMSEWITTETGVLIEIGDEEALVKAMSWMIDHYNQFDKELIKDSIWKRCSYEVVGKKFLEVYEDVLNH